MRAIFGLVVVFALLPLAAAQPTAGPAPSLALDPSMIDIMAGGSGNVTLLFVNPRETPITFDLSFASPPGVRVHFDASEITVPPGERTGIHATVVVADGGNVLHNVTIRALETNDSASAAGRDAPIPLRALLRVRVGDPPGLPPLELRLAPSDLLVPRGGNSTARLAIVNHGREMPMPQIEMRSMPGIVMHVLNAPEVLPANATTVVSLQFSHVGDQPLGTTFETVVGARSARASVPLRLELVRSTALGAPPSDRIQVPETAPPTGAPAVIAPSTPDASAAEIADLQSAESDGRVIAAVAVVGITTISTSLWLTRRDWWPLLAALYTRLKPSGLLDHPIRRRIVDLVKAEPGITFSELARKLDIAAGQLTHHARLLEKAGMIFSSPDGQTRRFFHIEHGRPESLTDARSGRRWPPGHVRVQEIPPLAERAIALVREQPRLASALAKDLGVSRQALHYHVKKLVAEGKLRARPEGRELWLEATA